MNHLRPTLARRATLPALGALAIAACAGAAAEGPLFVAGTPVDVGPGSGSIHLADLDRDGHLDLVTKHLLGKFVSVRRGDGKGGFGEATRTTFATEPGAIALAELDGDGVLDLGVAARDGKAEHVDVLPGDGKGGFRASAGGPFGAAPVIKTWKPRLRFADLDGDGKLDVVTANGRRATVEVLKADARGTFFARVGAVDLEAGRNLHTFAVGDVDGDGVPDLVTASSVEGDGPGHLETRRGDGKGGFGEASVVSTPLPPGVGVEALADMDGDGRLDVLLRHDASVSVLLNRQDDGRTAFVHAPGSPFATATHPYEIVAADLDRDGRADLVVATVSDAKPFESTVVVLLGDGGSLRPAPGSPFPAGKGAYCLAVGDVDGDGRLDLASSSFEGEAVTLLLGR